jgi:hypothetical protein
MSSVEAPEPAELAPVEPDTPSAEAPLELSEAEGSVSRVPVQATATALATSAEAAHVCTSLDDMGLLLEGAENDSALK